MTSSRAGGEITCITSLPKKPSCVIPHAQRKKRQQESGADECEYLFLNTSTGISLNSQVFKDVRVEKTKNRLAKDGFGGKISCGGKIPPSFRVPPRSPASVGSACAEASAERCVNPQSAQKYRLITLPLLYLGARWKTLRELRVRFLPALQS